MDLDNRIDQLPGIKPAAVKELHRLGIASVRDMLLYFPYRHEDFSNLVSIANIPEKEQVSIKAVIKQIKPINTFYGRINRAEAVVSDQTGSIKVIWFNQAYLANYLKAGDEIYLSGTARMYKDKELQLQNPIYEKAVPDKETVNTARILPIYRLGQKIPLRSFRTLMHECIPAAGELKEYLPAEMLREGGFGDQRGLPGIVETVRALHFPESEQALGRARSRIAFEEIFYRLVAVEKHKLENGKLIAPSIPFNKFLITKFLESLPFKLTVDQKKAIWEILQDLEIPHPMNRLLEGDVGSGKTLVAFASALEVLQSEQTVVLLCPTEILAQQHYRSAFQYFEQFPRISLMLFTSKRAEINGAAVTKKSMLEELAHGGPQLVISTHAALQRNVEFKNIALVIIDEQHRFGVRQRAALKQKTKKIQPHLLSMTATPIPRSLQLTIFGDLKISRILNKPAGRKPVAAKLVDPDQRARAYEFVRKEIAAGRQAFWVTPLIDESDKLGVKSAISEHLNLQKIFKEYKVGLLHGKMKPAEKELAMADFLERKTHILVSTSVIEVGIDVPNASVIAIEGAERFGLAQLHQFRGRVGRAEHQSYCLLFSENDSETSRTRLAQFVKIRDGFKLAELDLQTRGAGNIFGEEQSGFGDSGSFNYFSFHEFKDLAGGAAEWAQKILAADPKLDAHAYIKGKVAGKVIHLE